MEAREAEAPPFEADGESVARDANDRRDLPHEGVHLREPGEVRPRARAAADEHEVPDHEARVRHGLHLLGRSIGRHVARAAESLEEALAERSIARGRAERPLELAELGVEQG